MNYKISIAILALIVLGELGWLIWRVSNLKAREETGVGDKSEGRSKVASEIETSESRASLRQESVGGTAKLWLEPVEGEFSGQFSVDIMMQSNAAVDGVDVRLYYPADKLSVGEVGTGGLEEYPVARAENGLILLSGVVLGENEIVPLNQPFKVGSITFNTLAAGEAELSFDFTKGSSKDSNVAGKGLGEDILDEVSGVRFTLK